MSQRVIEKKTTIGDEEEVYSKNKLQRVSKVNYFKK